MAADTDDKRYSLIGLALGFGRLLPVPQGDFHEQGDRQEFAQLYRGILASGGGPVTVPFMNDVNTQIFVYLKGTILLSSNDNTSMTRVQIDSLTGEATARLKAIIVSAGTVN